MALVGLLPGCTRASPATACASAPPGTEITFSITVDPSEESALREVLDRFERRTGTKVRRDDLARFRPQEKVRVGVISVASAAERIAEDLEKSVPTIHLIAEDNMRLRELVDRGLIQDVSDVPIPREVVFSPVPPDLATLDGKRFFLPLRPNVRLGYADEKALRAAGVAPPRTTDELRKAAQALKERDGQPRLTLSLAPWEPAAVTISELIVSYGGNPLVLNDEGSVRAFEFLRGLWDDGLVAKEPSLLGKHDKEVTNLAVGPSYLAQNWSVTSAELAKVGQLQRFRVYAGWRGPQRAAHAIGGNVLAVPKNVVGRQREAAAALACWLMSKEAQQVLVRKNAWPAIRDDAYQGISRERRETVSAIQAAAQDGWYRPSLRYWPVVAEQIYTAMTQVLLAWQPVRMVLDQAHMNIVAAER